MRILNYRNKQKRRFNVDKRKTTSGANNSKKRRKYAKRYIDRTALYRSRAGINDWIIATNRASLIMPNNTELIRVF
jgi:hypothetical protein